MDIIYIYKLINENDCKDIEKYRNLAQVITRTICQGNGKHMLDLYGVELFKVNKKFSCERGMVLSKGYYCLVGEMSSYNADPQRGCRTNEEWDAISCEYDEMPHFVYADKDNKYLEKVTDFEFPQFPAEPFGTNNFLTIYELIGRSTINIKRYSEEDFTDFPDHLQIFRKLADCKKMDEIKSIENISEFVEFVVDKYEKECDTINPESSLVIGVIGRKSFFWECGIWYHKGSKGTITCAALEEFAPQCYSSNDEPEFDEDTVLFQKSYELPEDWKNVDAELDKAILALEEDIFDDDCDEFEEDDDDDDDCDEFDNFSLWDWIEYLSENPEDADKCDKWGKFNGIHWSLLLKEQPQFADKCDELNKWNKLSRNWWVELLCKQPQFADRCPFGKFTVDNWISLLNEQPALADKCPWKKFKDYSLRDLLEGLPQFADRCNLNNLGCLQWSYVLGAQPQFADRCPLKTWKIFWGHHWSWLLRHQPQFADKCDELKKWDKLDGRDWSSLLQEQPQFADKCDKWDKLDGRAWDCLLEKQPQFADKCDKWDKLDGFDWYSLLAKQPQFADKCDWDKLEGKHWRWLLEKQPQFADKCDWSKLDNKDWENLLAKQPQFADKRKK